MGSSNSIAGLPRLHNHAGGKGNLKSTANILVHCTICPEHILMKLIGSEKQHRCGNFVEVKLRISRERRGSPEY
jgi:hypothetical protein